jgi:hypothetical protein
MGMMGYLCIPDSHIRQYQQELKKKDLEILEKAAQ